MKIDLAHILSLGLKERFDYLRQNKADLIATKKSTPHTYDYKESIHEFTDKTGIPKKLEKATVLIFETNVKRSYNEKIFEMYKAGGVHQHSIGLQYIDMILALNDEDDKEHFKNWKDYIGMAINREKAEKEGFIFVVKEYRLIENSDVIYGANELTPTIEVNQIDQDNLLVKVVANTANWIDSQMDILLPGAAHKSINERKKLIPHLSNHNYSTEAKIGEVKDIYETIINLNLYLKAGEPPLQKQAVIAPVIDLSKIIFNLK